MMKERIHCIMICSLVNLVRVRTGMKGIFFLVSQLMGAGSPRDSYIQGEEPANTRREFVHARRGDLTHARRGKIAYARRGDVSYHHSGKTPSIELRPFFFNNKKALTRSSWTIKDWKMSWYEVASGCYKIVTNKTDSNCNSTKNIDRNTFFLLWFELWSERYKYPFGNRNTLLLLLIITKPEHIM